MRIAQLAEKYGIEKRTIDYYTTLGLIPFTFEEGSKYRDYGSDAETIIKKILILRDVGMSEKKIKEALNNPSYFTTAMWDEHIASLQAKISEVKKHYEEMIQYAIDMRNTSSISLNQLKDFDNPKAIRALTRIYARIQKYLDSPDTLTELSENLDEDLSDLCNCCYVFLKSNYKKMDQGFSYDSTEVQYSVEKFVHRIKGFFGTIVFLAVQFFKEFDPSILGLNAEDEEEYKNIMPIFDVCANWFRDAKTIEDALDFDKFANTYSEKIRAVDKNLGQSSFDDMTGFITIVCDLPHHITPDTIQMLRNKIIENINSTATSDEASEEDINKAKVCIDFISRAFQYYISMHQKAADSSQM